jgi:hypothetical protein
MLRLVSASRPMTRGSDSREKYCMVCRCPSSSRRKSSLLSYAAGNGSVAESHDREYATTNNRRNGNRTIKHACRSVITTPRAPATSDVRLESARDLARLVRVGAPAAARPAKPLARHEATARPRLKAASATRVPKTDVFGTGPQGSMASSRTVLAQTGS